MNEGVALSSLQQQKNVAQIIWNSNINIKCKPENVEEKKKKNFAHTRVCLEGMYVCVCLCVSTYCLINESFRLFCRKFNSVRNHWHFFAWIQFVRKNSIRTGVVCRVLFEWHLHFVGPFAGLANSKQRQPNEKACAVFHKIERN